MLGAPASAGALFIDAEFAGLVLAAFVKPAKNETAQEVPGYTLNDSPQPQVLEAFGFWKTKPLLLRPSL